MSDHLDKTLRAFTELHPALLLPPGVQIRVAESPLLLLSYKVPQGLLPFAYIVGMENVFPAVAAAEALRLILDNEADDPETAYELRSLLVARAAARMRQIEAVLQEA